VQSGSIYCELECNYDCSYRNVYTSLRFELDIGCHGRDMRVVAIQRGTQTVQATPSRCLFIDVIVSECLMTDADILRRSVGNRFSSINVAYARPAPSPSDLHTETPLRPPRREIEATGDLPQWRRRRRRRWRRHVGW